MADFSLWRSSKSNRRISMSASYPARGFSYGVILPASVRQ
jgi:hypothetical protein